MDGLTHDRAYRRTAPSRSGSRWHPGESGMDRFEFVFDDGEVDAPSGRREYPRPGPRMSRCAIEFVSI